MGKMVEQKIPTLDYSSHLSLSLVPMLPYTVVLNYISGKKLENRTIHLRLDDPIAISYPFDG